MARLGELLVQAGALSTEQLAFALRSQAQRGGRLGTNLVELGFLSENTLARTLATQLRIPAATAAALEAAQPDVLALVPADTAAHHRAIPIALEGQGAVWVAMSDPTDPQALADLSRITRRAVRPMVAAELLVDWALERHYGVRSQRRPATGDYRVDPLLDLQADQAAQAVLAAGAQVPTAFPETYSEAERRVIDARVLDLDERRGPARMGLAALATRLVQAGSQREAFDALCAFVSQDFRRVTVAVLRSERLVGFMGIERGLALSGLPEASARPEELPIIARVLADGRPRLGRASEKTFGALGPLVGNVDTRAVVVLPLRCAGDPVGAVIGVGGADGVERWAEEYAAAAWKTDLALQVVLLRRKIVEGVGR